MPPPRRKSPATISHGAASPEGMVLSSLAGWSLHRRGGGAFPKNSPLAAVIHTPQCHNGPLEAEPLPVTLPSMFADPLPPGAVREQPLSRVREGGRITCRRQLDEPFLGPDRLGRRSARRDDRPAECQPCHDAAPPACDPVGVRLDEQVAS